MYIIMWSYNNIHIRIYIYIVLVYNGVYTYVPRGIVMGHGSFVESICIYIYISPSANKMISFR